MKKVLYMIMMASLLTSCSSGKEDQTWFTLENIEYDEESNSFIGNCIEGNYEGEILVNIPDTIDLPELKDGMTVKVLGGPGMTMSLPAQLTSVSEIEIVE